MKNLHLTGVFDSQSIEMDVMSYVGPNGSPIGFEVTTGAPGQPRELFFGDLEKNPKEMNRYTLNILGLLLANLQQNRLPLRSELFFAVNMSTQEFMRPGFAAIVRAWCLQHDLPPRQLGVELTERYWPTDPIKKKHIVQNAVELKRAGIVLLADDVTLDEASLDRVRTINPHFIKFDKTVTGGLIRDPNQTLRHPRFQEALAFGARVIFEGIDSFEQVNTINALLRSSTRSEQINYQGYAFDLPRPLRRDSSTSHCEEFAQQSGRRYSDRAPL